MNYITLHFRLHVDSVRVEVRNQNLNESEVLHDIWCDEPLSDVLNINEDH